MSISERFAVWYEHECDCNDKMLTMIESVPVAKRDDARFKKVLTLAAHLAACRENWLDRMIGESRFQTDWWPENVELESLRARYQTMQEAWRAYLKQLDDSELDRVFEFPTQSLRYKWGIEGQIVQLLGHAFYHRGQICQLVDELGGETVDTDYLFWAFGRDERFGTVNA